MRKLLAGALLTKGIRFGYKAAKRKYPELGRWLSTHQKAQKVSLPGSGTKMNLKDIQKLALAESTQNKIKQLARIKWGKARRSFKQSSLPSTNLYWKGYLRRTKKKLDILHKDVKKIEAYKTKLESKWSTKHALGGEVVIGKNIDGGLL